MDFGATTTVGMAPTIWSPPTTHLQQTHSSYLWQCNSGKAVSIKRSPESRSAKDIHQVTQVQQVSGSVAPRTVCAAAAILRSTTVPDSKTETFSPRKILASSMAQHHWAEPTSYGNRKAPIFFLPAMKIPNKFSTIGGSTSSKSNPQISRMVSLLAQIGSNDVPSSKAKWKNFNSCGNLH